MVECEDSWSPWRTSSASADAECVEVRLHPLLGAEVRHSRDRQGAILAFTPTEWKAFERGVLAGEFSLPS